MNKKPKNKTKSLHEAKILQNDEFYTRIEDIEDELKHYSHQFENKIIYCNCDDPLFSNFYRYFAINFKELKLKKLISSCYKDSEINLLNDKVVHGHYYEYNGLDNEKQIPSIEDLKYFKGNGDFRSSESIELLKQSDIVVTNPPFSLFREFMQQLFLYNKKFLVVGNMNAASYKDIIFKFINNKIWLTKGGGGRFNGFIVPEHYEQLGYNVRKEDSCNIVDICASTWFTNIDCDRIRPMMDLLTMEENMKRDKVRNSKTCYKKYDNYKDVLEVSYSDCIPSDYDGVMGVPVSFLEKYNPLQFEVLGMITNEYNNDFKQYKLYNDYWKMDKNGKKVKGNGSDINGDAVLNRFDKNRDYYVNRDGHEVQGLYKRIFIKHKKY